MTKTFLLQGGLNEFFILNKFSQANELLITLNLFIEKQSNDTTRRQPYFNNVSIASQEPDVALLHTYLCCCGTRLLLMADCASPS
jgi:hypothetical protein